MPDKEQPTTTKTATPADQAATPANAAESKPRKPRDASLTEIRKRKEEAKKKADQLAARLQDLEAQEKVAARKADTRAKTVIGGYVLALIASGEEAMVKNLLDIRRIKLVAERDQPLVKDAIQRAIDRRTPPSPTAQNSTTPTKGTGG